MKNTVYCQSGGGANNKAIRSSGLSSVLTDRTLIGEDQGHSASNIEIGVKEFDHSLLEMQQGIGIVKFLGGKGFFITGATGFLAKGTIFTTWVVFTSQKGSKGSFFVCVYLQIWGKLKIFLY